MDTGKQRQNELVDTGKQRLKELMDTGKHRIRECRGNGERLGLGELDTGELAPVSVVQVKEVDRKKQGKEEGERETENEMRA